MTHGVMIAPPMECMCWPSHVILEYPLEYQRVPRIYLKSCRLAAMFLSDLPQLRSIQNRILRFSAVFRRFWAKMCPDLNFDEIQDRILRQPADSGPLQRKWNTIILEYALEYKGLKWNIMKRI